MVQSVYMRPLGLCQAAYSFPCYILSGEGDLISWLASHPLSGAAPCEKAEACLASR